MFTRHIVRFASNSGAQRSSRTKAQSPRSSPGRFKPFRGDENHKLPQMRGMAEVGGPFARRPGSRDGSQTRNGTPTRQREIHIRMSVLDCHPRLAAPGARR
jgi:hypothetical protein